MSMDITKFRKAIFWDTSMEKIDWIAHKRYVIQRVMDRGDETEIMEIIKFYGRDVILANIDTNNPYNIHTNENVKRYLDNSKG